MLVSPRIEAGTVFRVPAGGVPLDHTSILATIEHRWSLPPLTARDATAPDLSAVLTLTTARTDDPLQDITAPTASTLPAPLATQPAHLQQVQAELTARLITEGHTDGQPPPTLHTSADYDNYITRRIHIWETTRT